MASNVVVNEIRVRAFSAQGNSQKMSYTVIGFIGEGTFGEVHKARLSDGDIVAIKKVLNNKYAERELRLMISLDHCNIVKLKYYFISYCERKKKNYLHFIMEIFPETLFTAIKQYTQYKLTLPIFYIKVYMYQLFRALAYIHSCKICHRDIKPENLLLNPKTLVLKICDFGCAKEINREEQYSNICTLYYRAPEILLSARNYTIMVDIWSAGCILAELLLGEPIFPGRDEADQIDKIAKILGKPNNNQLQKMNSSLTVSPCIPNHNAKLWENVFKDNTSPEAIELVSKLLNYIPPDRYNALLACADSLFDELRNPDKNSEKNRQLPPLFDFSQHELKNISGFHFTDDILVKLKPRH